MVNFALEETFMLLSELVGGAPAVAMLGMCKNAGKTTAMNRLIREFAAAGRVIAVTSVGRDGERRDLVTGTEKPPIYLYEGMLCATAEQLLPFSDVSREILALPELYTSLGQIVVFRARSDGYAQLAGPSIVEQLSGLRETLALFGAGCVLIDGALSRRSPAAGVSASGGCCVLSTGASLDRDIDRVVAETAFAARLLTLPEAAEDGGERMDLPGALTESRALTLLRSGGTRKGLTVRVRDGSCYLLKRETFEKLEALGVRFTVAHGTRLAAVTVNPVSAGGWRFDRDEFLEKMRAVSPAPVLDTGRYDGTQL